ncbi:hypothetical protein JCM3775_001336 [Rhodotorula graminis]|uniref:Transcription factor TFIIIC triple barrel domain-containing protein n=1 Tax=Rhodotorula graminis (strain WP1) TaxID=578459 RepID=A0A194S6S5_RHOGW|nr:uncharacterized protein RHOBADRAFT_52283 [Rhodotorula graminis WP1]KPV76249.1 hypothetical protein RHOBADRAFT_52283 [Rhodotorula graminis WP1]
MAIPPTRPRPTQPVLNSNWRRVEHLVPRELLNQVDGPDGDDDEWEEDEVEYVTLDFGPYLEAKALAEHDAIQLLAPESTTPMALLGDRYFQGLHEPLVGSDILFLRNDNTTPAFQPFTTSSHRISFQPVALVPPSGMANALGVPPPSKAHTKKAQREADAAAAAAAAAEQEAQGELGPDGQPKRKRGRPKGSKNKPKTFSVGQLTGQAPLGDEVEPAGAARGRETRAKDKGKGKEVVGEEEGEDEGESGEGGGEPMDEE